MKVKALLAIALLLPATLALGQGPNNEGGRTWYGTVTMGYLTEIDSAGQFLGRTQSVYGGSPHIPLDRGKHLGLAIGRQLYGNWWLEAEVAATHSDTASNTYLGTGLRDSDVFRLGGQVRSIRVMGNLGYDFTHLNSRIIPYARIGIGLANNKVDALLDVEYDSAIWNGSRFDEQTVEGPAFPEGRSSEFAWSAGIGFKAHLNRRVAIRLEYEVSNLGEAWTAADPNTDFVLFSDHQSEQINLRLDLNFD